MNHSKATPPPRNNLPIIQHLLRAYLLWQEYVHSLPKKSRYTIGARIEKYFLDTLEAVFLASVSDRAHRLVYVERAVVKFDALKFFLQVAWESKVLDTKKYTALSSILEGIGKMLGGWRRNLVTQTPAHNGREK